MIAKLAATTALVLGLWLLLTPYTATVDGSDWRCGPAIGIEADDFACDPAASVRRDQATLSLAAAAVLGVVVLRRVLSAVPTAEAAPGALGLKLRWLLRERSREREERERQARIARARTPS